MVGCNSDWFFGVRDFFVFFLVLFMIEDGSGCDVLCLIFFCKVKWFVFGIGKGWDSFGDWNKVKVFGFFSFLIFGVEFFLVVMLFFVLFWFLVLVLLIDCWMFDGFFKFKGKFI